MHIYTLKTHKVTSSDSNIYSILDKYLETVVENSVIAITSKIIAICEGRIVKIKNTNKDDLAIQEADYYIPRVNNKYDSLISVKGNTMISVAGIDESNGDGFYVLWPNNAQKTAEDIWHYLKKRFALNKVGVIITDTHSVPLQLGSSGVALAHCGFRALKNYIGAKDLFGHTLKFSRSNVMNGLAVSAVLVMGEGSEQTPIAVINDVPFVDFVESVPSAEELSSIRLTLQTDLFHELLNSPKWIKGRTG